MMTIEELDKVLSHPNIQVEAVPDTPGEFQRNRWFTLNGKRYCIEWWCNISYLHVGSMIVPFQRVKQAGTWPIMSKLNLQFYDSRDAVCCVIADLEKYPQEPRPMPTCTVTIHGLRLEVEYTASGPDIEIHEIRHKEEEIMCIVDDSIISRIQREVANGQA
jgi:hypothetical protein